MKLCLTCGEHKGPSEFHFSHTLPGGLQGKCKSCCSLFSAKKGPDGLTYHQRRHRSNPEKTRERHLRGLYGLSIEQWDEMILNQGGMCAICNEDATLGVDHDHESRKVRGLLCSNCNTAIGLFKDSPDRTEAATNYLKRHGK